MNKLTNNVTNLMNKMIVCAGVAMDTQVYNCAMAACSVPPSQTLPVSSQSISCWSLVTSTVFACLILQMLGISISTVNAADCTTYVSHSVAHLSAST